MHVVFHPEAEAEFLNAIDHYETRAPGLGREFSFEVYAAIQNVVDLPAAWPVLENDIRRCLTHRFPYAVLYAEESGQIQILAVMHLHQEPGYWRQRI